MASSIKLPLLWITGLSGSGKTTLAEAVETALTCRGFHTRHIDGDALRKIHPTGFTQTDRIRNMERAAALAFEAQSQGVVPIVSLISPYRKARYSIRRRCHGFFEIYLNTPLCVCEKRDGKGLYKKVRLGQIKNFTGIDSPYEAPTNPEITIDTTDLAVDQCVHRVLRRLMDHF